MSQHAWHSLLLECTQCGTTNRNPFLTVLGVARTKAYTHKYHELKDKACAHPLAQVLGCCSEGIYRLHMSHVSAMCSLPPDGGATLAEPCCLSGGCAWLLC